MKQNKRNHNKRRRPGKRGNPPRNGGFTGQQWLPPNYRLGPQRLGSGTTTRWIEQQYAQTTELAQVTMSSLIQASADFAIMATNYRFIKLEKIVMTVYPQATAIRIYVLNRYTDDTGATNIEQNDSTKIVQTHAMNNRYIKWMPPNANLFIPRNSGNNVTNYRVWTICDDLLSNGQYTIPGNILIKIQPSSNVTVNYRISLKFSYRGADVPDATKMYHLADVIAGIEKKNVKMKTPQTIMELKPCGFNSDSEYEDEEEEINKWMDENDKEKDEKQNPG